MVSRYSGAPLSDAELTKACGPRHEGRFAGARATLRSWGDATDGARGDALSGDSRERETATSEFRPLRFGDGAVHAFGGLFGFSRAVRLLGRFPVRPAVGRAVAGGERRCGVVCCFVCLSHPPTLGGSLLSEFDVLGPWAWRVFSAGVCRCLWTRDPVAIRRL